MAQLDQERGKLALQLGRSLLDTAATRAAANGVEAVETRLRHGNFVEELVALEGEARLMVVGKTGLDHGDELRSIGSHIETLIRAGAYLGTHCAANLSPACTFHACLRWTRHGQPIPRSDY